MKQIGFAEDPKSWEPYFTGENLQENLLPFELFRRLNNNY